MQGSFRHYRPLYNRERIERPAVRADGLNLDRVLGRTRNDKGVRGVVGFHQECVPVVDDAPFQAGAGAGRQVLHLVSRRRIYWLQR